MTHSIDAAVQIVVAYISVNALEPEKVPTLLGALYMKLESLKGKVVQQPVVPVEESYTPDYITCLEDGAQVILLKRYLAKRFNMTPEQYREKWNLPEDYPMVAKSYSEKRSQIAKDTGLGKSAG